MSQAPRSGNAIVVAMGVFTIAAVMVATAVDSATSTAKLLGAELGHSRALAALDVVLSRREMDIVDRAGQGDMAEIARWNQNYGVDFIGGVEVRWKIEPWRTQPTDAAGNDVHHITNPNPDTSWTASESAPKDSVGSPYWQPNDNNFMFRVSAQAQDGVDPNVDPDSPSQLSASGKKVVAPAHVVQGTRYTSVIKEPLFRYVIFYAARGAKGDLELSHAGNVEIQGSVHSNGSLYIGSGLKVNDKVARVGALTSTMASAYTKIGPDVEGKPVRVNGVDGIFRISKPLMYSIFNGFHLYDNSVPGAHGNPNASAGAAAVSWATNGSTYDLTSDPDKFPIPDPAGATLADVLSATDSGRRINPYRVLNGSGAITENYYSNPDDLRTINGVELRGVAVSADGRVANDSRDAQRPAEHKWNVLSMQGSSPGFDGKARTRTTGQNLKNIPERMRNRGFEAQRLEYADNDGDDATDEHEFARPLFVRADGTTTTDYPRSALSGFPTFDGNAVVEEPGQYLRYAMGEGSYMVRYADGTGWYIRGRDGVRRPDMASAGLIIRERPAPSVAHWPGTDKVSVVSPSDPRWVPYAYGKHWFPSRFPFTVADIADEVAPSSGTVWLSSWYSGNRNPLEATKINTSPNNRIASYAPGGVLRIAAACNASSDKSITAALDGVGNVYRRKPYYYAQNWRFVNLGASTPAEDEGMLATVFRDVVDLPDRTPVATSFVPHSLVGGPVSATATTAGVVMQDVVVTAPTVTGLSLSAGRSVRYVGFLEPTASGTYEFQPSSTSNVQVRVWVQDELRYSNWGVSSTKSVELAGGKSTPIQIDVTCTGTPSSSFTVQWKAFGAASWSSLTTGAKLYQPKQHPGFARSEFRSAVVRLDTASLAGNPPQAKVGLMLRDGSGRMSPLLNGASQYGFIGYSPARGVFIERQTTRHMVDQRTQGTFYVGNGQHSAANSSSLCNTYGEVVENSNSVSGVQRFATLTEVTPRVPSTTVAMTGFPNYQNQGVNYTDKIPLTPTSSLNTYAGSLSKDVGGGKIWTLDTAPIYGQKKQQRTGTPWRRSRTRSAHVQHLAIQLNNPVGVTSLFYPRDPLDSSRYWDRDRWLDLYTAITGTGGYTTNNAEATIRYALANAPIGSAAPTWGTWPAAADGNYTNNGYTTDWYFYGNTGEQVPYPMLRRAWGNFSQAEAIANGAPQDTALVTFGTANSIWNLASIKINKAGTVSSATLSDVNAVCGTSYTNAPSTPAPTLSTITYPAYPAYPAAPAVVARALPDFATPRYFQTQRVGATINFDMNGWMTRSGTAFSPAVPQYLPTLGGTWLATWPGNTPTDWPKTNSFRPDMWTASVAPVRSTVAVDPHNTNVTSGQSVRNGATPWRMSDDIAVSAPTAIWLAIESLDGNTCTFRYSTDGTTWTTVLDPTTGVPSTLDASGWGSHVLTGPAVQSGDVATTATAVFSQMSVSTASSTIDASTWDEDEDGEDIMGRYLASQYQVWWGTREITEDFFTYTDTNTGRRLATEDWIYNAREFWSQSRWWDVRRSSASMHMTPTDLVEKDAVASAADNLTKTRIREAFAKTTLLTVDMEALQNYMRARLLSEACADRLTGHMDTSPVTDDGLLKDRFSGLIYVVRTNRYPWNPNLNDWFLNERLSATADNTGINPWSPHWLSPLPNSRSTMNEKPQLGNDASLRSPPLPPQGNYAWLTSDQGHVLQPYLSADLKEDLPLKPQQFHHGVRFKNASRISWGYDAAYAASSDRTIGGKKAFDWSLTPVPAFGTSKMSIVSPNPVYIQGNFNVDRFKTKQAGNEQYRFTPVALMADSVTVLSNAWQDENAQIPGLTVSNVAGSGSVSGAGSLATMSNQGWPASDAEYNMAIATHNIPTNRDRVAEGQSAGFVDSMLLLENWNTRTMKYLGSLVVMDSRRYSTAFLHDSFKTYGQTPFGIIDNDGNWLGALNGFVYRRADRDGTMQTFKTGMYGFNVASAHWAGQSPAILSEANRVYEFNYDLLTEEGTPPFAPFGVSTAGIGGWVRVVK